MRLIALPFLVCLLLCLAVWLIDGCATSKAVHDFAVEGKNDLHAFAVIATNGMGKIIDARMVLLKGEIESNRLWVKILTYTLPAVGAGAWYIERTLTKRGEQRKEHHK